MGSAVYRMAGQGVHVSQKGVTRHGTVGGTSLRAELLAADMHTWSTLPTTTRVKWELAAVENLSTSRRYWLQWRSWLRATAHLTSWASMSAGFVTAYNRAFVYVSLYHRVITFGQGGTSRIVWSDDGLTWVPAIGDTAGVWNCACFALGFGKVLALGVSGTIRAAYSYDGTAWMTGTMAEGNTWVSCCFSQELRIAVAVSSNGVHRTCYTENGIDWVAGTGGGTETWSGVAYSPELQRFAAVAYLGSYQAMFSNDGKTWTDARMPVLNAWRAIAWCPWLHRFVALREASSQNVGWSDDGNIWHVSGGPVGKMWRTIIAIEELQVLVAIAQNDSESIWMSRDGLAWTSLSIEASLTPYGAVWSPWHGSVFVGNSGATALCVQSPITFVPSWPDGTPLIADHMDPLPDEVAQRPVSAMTCPSVDWFVIYEVTVGAEQRITFTPSGQLQTGAGIAWLEVFVGTPLKGARNYYKGELKPMGLRPMGSAPYPSSYFVYPFAESLSGGSRIPVKMRVLARGGRVSPWVKGIATITT